MSILAITSATGGLNDITIVYAVTSGVTITSLKLIVNNVTNPLDSVILAYNLASDLTTFTTPSVLANGEQYSLQLQQINSTGAVIYSASTTATPVLQGPPLTPVLSNVVRGDNSIAFNMETGIVQGAPLLALTFVKCVGATITSSTWTFAGSVSSGSGVVSVTQPYLTQYYVVLSGLTNETFYEIEGQSINVYGSSPSSETVTATPANVAMQVTGLALAAVADRKFTATWDAVSAIAPDSLESYTLTYTIGSSSVVITGLQTLTYTSPVLAAGANVSVSVFAVLRIGGDGDPSASSTIIAYDEASAPTSLSVTASNLQLIFTWIAPALNGMSLSHYEISKDGETTWTNNGTATSITFNGLINGITYNLSVRANTLNANLNNELIYGDIASTTGTPYASALAPTGLAVIPSSEQLIFSYVEPDLDGLPLKRYDVSKDNGATWIDNLLATNKTFTGLTNGISYTLQARAVTSDVNNGNADVFGASASIVGTPFTQASAPASVGVLSTDETLVVSHNAVSGVNLGGMALAYYMLQVNNATAVKSTDVNSGYYYAISNGSPTWTISGLTNETSYSIKVWAVTTDINVATSGTLITGAQSTTSGIPSGQPIIDSIGITPYAINSDSIITAIVRPNGAKLLEYFIIYSNGTIDQVLNADISNPATSGSVTLTIYVPLNTTGGYFSVINPRGLSHTTF